MPFNVDPSMKILIVDDLSAMRHIMRTSLQSLGFTNITEAVDGLDGLEKLEHNEFQLIISDWNMPKMQGVEFLRRVRANAHHKTVPFLMVTAEAKRENVIEAASAGVSQYIVKPFTVESLQTKITAIFDRIAKKSADHKVQTESTK